MQERQKFVRRLVAKDKSRTNGWRYRALHQQHTALTLHNNG